MAGRDADISADRGESHARHTEGWPQALYALYVETSAATHGKRRHLENFTQCLGMFPELRPLRRHRSIKRSARMVAAAHLVAATDMIRLSDVIAFASYLQYWQDRPGVVRRADRVKFVRRPPTGCGMIVELERWKRSVTGG
jgi:hypothetical protein